MPAKNYTCTLRKTAIINGQEIAPGIPLIIRLYDTETPKKYYLRVKHEVSRIAFGGLKSIGYISLMDINGLIEWGKVK